jgi:hypothetical protein
MISAHGLTVLELALQQYERIGSHVGVKQGAVPVVSFATVKHQPIAHRGKRLTGAWEKLGPLFSGFGLVL